MAAITEDETKKIMAFRKRVDEFLKDDYTKSALYLIRWLRARDCDLDNAELMIRNHYKWREENKIDFLLADPPENYFVQNYRYWLNGEDKNARPVLCIAMGEWDVRKVVDDNRVPEFIDYMNRMYERVVENIKSSNARRKPGEEAVTQFVCIVDWDGFTGRQTASLKAMQAMLNSAMVYEAHYPEILGQGFFINTNPFFQIFFALMKPILAPRTLSKLELYGTNRSEWEPIVRNVVEEHQIPRQFGG